MLLFYFSQTQNEKVQNMIALSDVKIIGMAKSEPLLRPLGSFQIPADFPSQADECVEELDIGAYLIRQPDSTYLM